MFGVPPAPPPGWRPPLGVAMPLNVLTPLLLPPRIEPQAAACLARAAAHDGLGQKRRPRTATRTEELMNGPLDRAGLVALIVDLEGKAKQSAKRKSLAENKNDRNLRASPTRREPDDDHRTGAARRCS